MASMLRDLEAINAGADRAVLANPLLTGDLEGLARAYSGDRARDGVWRRRSRPDGARAQRRHEGRHRVAGRADVMAPTPERSRSPSAIPAGIGPEIVEKAAADPSVRAVCEPIVFAPPADRDIRPGEVSAAAGRAAYDTLRARRRAARSGEVDAIATAPINKLAFAQAGLEWKGHTDLLAHLCGTPRRGDDVSLAATESRAADGARAAAATCRRCSRRSCVDRTIALTRDAMSSFGVAAAAPGARRPQSARRRRRRDRRRRRSRAGAGGAARPRAGIDDQRADSRATPCSCAPRAASSTA